MDRKILIPIGIGLMVVFYAVGFKFQGIGYFVRDFLSGRIFKNVPGAWSFGKIKGFELTYSELRERAIGQKFDLVGATKIHLIENGKPVQVISASENHTLKIDAVGKIGSEPAIYQIGETNISGVKMRDLAVWNLDKITK